MSGVVATAVSAEVHFRFDAGRHEYVIAATGEVRPHITGMLERCGWINDEWYTIESCERGQCAHRLAADYDLGALDPSGCVSKYRGYLLSHISAMTVLCGLGCEVLEVEEPAVHPVYRYGGRPDRVLRLMRLGGVLELKTGKPEKSHMVQTALQAILRASAFNLDPRMLRRWALYLSDKGKFKLEEHKQGRDFDEAYRIIRRCC